MADQGAQGILSPFLRRQRIRAALPYLRGKILDVGCGSGALTEYVSQDNYIGIDIDSESIDAAQQDCPAFAFIKTDDPPEGPFDTIVALAVIEHVTQPTQFLSKLTARLAHHVEARIICTTPHPSMDWIHAKGARIGLFSSSANEEHEELLDFTRLQAVGAEVGLALKTYKRFLLGANQLAIFCHAKY